jgi:hypothetical protein
VQARDADQLGGGAKRDVDDLMSTWVCVLDEGLHAVLAGKRLRRWGARPTRADREVLTREVVGE